MTFTSLHGLPMHSPQIYFPFSLLLSVLLLQCSNLATRTLDLIVFLTRIFFLPYFSSCTTLSNNYSFFFTCSIQLLLPQKAFPDLSNHRQFPLITYLQIFLFSCDYFIACLPYQWFKFHESTESSMSVVTVYFPLPLYIQLLAQ